MSAFDLATSFDRLEQRLGDARRARLRSDRGHSRLDPAVERRIRTLLLTQEKPSMADARRRLEGYCEPRGLNAPSRATLYNAMDRVAMPSLSSDASPDAVRTALYNLDLHPPGAVASDHVAFYAFNHGDARALSFGAGSRCSARRS